MPAIGTADPDKIYASVCKHHGETVRYKSNASCVHCLKDNFYKWRRKPEVAKDLTVKRAIWDKENPVKAMLQGARARAKKLNLEFNLTPNDIVIPTHCPVFGFPLKRGGGKSKTIEDTTPSLDRIDGNQGYIVGNVVIVSWLANRIKGRFTIDELQKVVSFYEKLPNSQISAIQRSCVGPVETTGYPALEDASLYPVGVQHASNVQPERCVLSCDPC